MAAPGVSFAQALVATLASLPGSLPVVGRPDELPLVLEALAAHRFLLVIDHPAWASHDPDDLATYVRGYPASSTLAIVGDRTPALSLGPRGNGVIVRVDQAQLALTRGDLERAPYRRVSAELRGLASEAVARIPGGDYTVTTTDNLVTVTLNADGRTLLEAHRDLDVVTTITVSVGAEDADGIVPNKASFVPNQAWSDQNKGKGIESNEVLTKYGNLVVTEKDAKTAALLSGAQFAVYVDPDWAGPNAAAASDCARDQLVPANQVGGLVTTDAQGVATFKGLQTSDFYNGAVQSKLIQYCLVETKAPADYNLNAQAINVVVKSTGALTLASTSETVLNQKRSLDNHLPLTGGDGLAALSVGGLALIAGGVGYYAFGVRRRRHSA